MKKNILEYYFLRIYNFQNCLEEKIKLINVVNRVVSYKSAEVISKLCGLHVRSHLDTKDADMMKGIRRRATKIIPNLRNLLYKKKLKRSGLFSLTKA